MLSSLEEHYSQLPLVLLKGLSKKTVVAQTRIMPVPMGVPSEPGKEDWFGIRCNDAARLAHEIAHNRSTGMIHVEYTGDSSVCPTCDELSPVYDQRGDIRRWRHLDTMQCLRNLHRECDPASALIVITG